MTPSPHEPFLLGSDIGDGFLMVEFSGGVEAGSRAGEACAHIEVVAHSNTNTAMKARAIKAEAPGF
jgi:hypothetical protein